MGLDGLSWTGPFLFLFYFSRKMIRLQIDCNEVVSDYISNYSYNYGKILQVLPPDNVYKNGFLDKGWLGLVLSINP